MDQIRGLLQQYIGGDPQQAPADVHQHFDQVAQAAPQNAVSSALSSVMRSDQTPPFGQMVSNLFGSSNGQQKAGLLNTILGAVGSGGLQNVLSSTGLGNILGGGQQQQVTPDQAQQVSPQDVQQLASHAEKQDPSIVDRVSDFYSQHPTAIKALGGAALAMIMSHMGQQSQQS